MADPSSVSVSTNPETNPILATEDAPEVPEKFRNAEGGIDAEKALKSALELEKKLRGGGKLDIPDDEGDDGETTDDAEGIDLADDAEKEAEEKPDESPDEAPAVPIQDDGLPGSDEQRAEWGEQWVAEGKLADEHYDQLKSALGEGVTREMVDNYFRGLAAQQQTEARTVSDILGGAEQTQAIREWADQGGLSEAQLRRHNLAMKSSDPAERTEALEGLRLRFEAARGRVGRTIKGGGGGGNAKPFNSRQERLEAMQDPRYAKSEAYRQEVRARSQAAGLI